MGEEHDRSTDDRSLEEFIEQTFRQVDDYVRSVGITFIRRPRRMQVVSEEVSQVAAFRREKKVQDLHP